MSMKTVKIIDMICVLLFLFMGLYIFILPESMQDHLLPVFTVINPYQTGAWIMGAGFFVTCTWGKGKIGVILGVVMLFCYIVTAAVSLVGLIVVTVGWDLLWYLHPVLALLGLIVWIRRRIRQKKI